MKHVAQLPVVLSNFRRQHSSVTQSDLERNTSSSRMQLQIIRLQKGAEKTVGVAEAQRAGPQMN